MTRASFAGTGLSADEVRAKVKGRIDNLPKTLTDRAKKRLDHVQYKGDDTWWVEGQRSLGDASNFYVVIHDGKRYDCDCYHTQHGESRARRLCSHVAAVIMWRTKNKHTEHDVDAVSEVEGDTNNEEDMGVVASGETSASPSISLTASLTAPAPSELKFDVPLVQEAWQMEGRFDFEQWELQWHAANEIVGHFNAGIDLVMLDAPTGSGKTSIADLVARLMDTPAQYICERKPLQDQVLGDFPYARVLKGRANYPTQHGLADVTCDDCDMTPGQDDCSFCDSAQVCPYRMAKRQALSSQLAILNTAYWLREVNYVGDFDPNRERAPRARHGLLVIDECDTLEDQLLNFIEFRLTRGRCRELGVEPPKSGSHYTTIAKWLTETFDEACKKALMKMPDSVAGRRKAKGLNDLREQGKELATHIVGDHEWIRDTKDAPLLMKPVRVAPYANRYLWSHTKKVLMMSATIISADELAETLGYEGQYAVVRVPMTFPVENRVVHVAPVANNTYKERDEAWPKIRRAVEKIMERHPTDRILVHTVSYDLSHYLMARLRNAAGDRALITYSKAADRDHALAVYRQTPAAVMLASSFDRGVDLRHDDCRVVVVTKVPFPSMGDVAVSTRLHGPDGQQWYTVQTIRSLVQMTGRGVRAKDDWCTSYILDAQFTKNIWKKDRALLPEWWVDALDRSFATRELM